MFSSHGRVVVKREAVVGYLMFPFVLQSLGVIVLLRRCFVQALEGVMVAPTVVAPRLRADHRGHRPTLLRREVLA